MSVPDKNLTHYCSFCGKSQQEVRVMLAGPAYVNDIRVNICDECVGISLGLLLEKGGLYVSEILFEIRTYKEKVAREKAKLEPPG